MNLDFQFLALYIYPLDNSLDVVFLFYLPFSLPPRSSTMQIDLVLLSVLEWTGVTLLFSLTTSQKLACRDFCVEIRQYTSLPVCAHRLVFESSALLPAMQVNV